MFTEFIGIMGRHHIKGDRSISSFTISAVTAGLFLWLCFFGSTAVFGQVDSQWRGPGRTGIYPGEKLLDSWPDGGPKLLWSANGLGEGYSSAAVTGNRIYVTGLIKNEKFLFMDGGYGTDVRIFRILPDGSFIKKIWVRTGLTRSSRFMTYPDR